MKINNVVKRETINIAIGILICSVITQILFFIIGKYDLRVLLGSVYGGVVVLMNFFLMGLTVQNVTNIEDQKEAKKKIQFSYSIRQLALFLLIGAGMYFAVTYEVLHWFPILISLLYPRVTIAVISIYRRKLQLEGGENE